MSYIFPGFHNSWNWVMVSQQYHQDQIKMISINFPHPCLNVFCIYGYLQQHLPHLGFLYPWNLESLVSKPVFIKPKDALGPNLAKSRNLETGIQGVSFTLTFDSLPGNGFADIPVKFQSDMFIITPTLATSKTSRSRDKALVRLVNKGQEVQSSSLYQVISVPIHPVLSNYVLWYLNGFHNWSPEAHFTERHSLNK